MQESIPDTDRLPQPFDETAWPTALRPGAQALWRWHLSLSEPIKGWEAGADIRAFFDEEYTRAEAGQPLRVVPASVAEAAYAACRTHALPLSVLAEQVKAAARFTEPIRFATYADLQVFVQQGTGSHARLLARMAGQKGSWQRPSIDELARAFFLTGRLVYLPDDLARDRLFIPLDEMRQAGVSLEQLQAGTVDEAMKRLFWKQTVRIRDAFAQGQNLAKDLSGWQRRAFKRWWLGGLYVLSEIERRDYDVWSKPVALSGLKRMQVRLQALVGKTSFR